MAEERYKSVSTFLLPDEYQRQASEARRRRRMAEMLAQQEYQPGNIQNAPIPSAAPLVQGLQAYLTARAARKADEAEESAEEKASQIGSQIAGRLTGREIVPIAPVVPGAPVVPVDSVALEKQRQIQEEKNLLQRNAEEQDQLKSGDIQEVARQSQYVYDPKDAMRLAMTSGGNAAMRGNPMLAAMLAKTMEKPVAEEFYAPTETADGLVQYGKRGGRITTVDKAAPKAPDLPGDVQSYQFYVKQETDAGRTPKSFEAFKMSQRASTSVHLPPSPRDLQKDEGGLRDQLQSRLKSMDWDGVKSAYQRIFTAPENTVGDVAIVYAVAKADDSTGAVRKEDFDLRAKSGSLGARIQSLYEEAVTGRMVPKRRQELIDTAYTLYTARQKEVNEVIDEYGNIASRSGLNVDNVVKPFQSKDIGRRVVWSKEKQDELDRLAKKGGN